MLGLLAGVGSVVGGLVGARSADKAADAQRNAARADLQFQRRVYDDTVGRFSPFYDQGVNGLNAYAYEMGFGPKPQGYAGYEMSPAAKYALEQGRGEIEAGAAYAGGLNSGRTAAALEDYRQGTVLSDRDNYLNRLLGLSSMGQNAAGNIGTAGSNLGASASNAYGAMGNASAAGAIGVGNAVNSGLSGLTNALTYGYQMKQQPSYGPGQMTPGMYSGGASY